jgi:hypothetical protein
VQDRVEVRSELSAAQPVVHGELVVSIPAAGMQKGVLPVAAEVEVHVGANDADSARPLARLLIDGRVSQPPLLADPEQSASFTPEPGDPAAGALAPWYESTQWSHQAAISGFDQNNGETTMPLALPCREAAACEQRLPFELELLEAVDGSVVVDWDATARLVYSKGHAEIAPDPPPDGAAVTVRVDNVRSGATTTGRPPGVQVVDRGPTGAVPVTIDFPVAARQSVVRLVTGPTAGWSRGDVVIDGWPARRIITSAGRGVAKVPLVEGTCDGGRCRLVGEIGDRRRPEAGPLRVAVEVRGGPAVDAPSASDITVTFG